MLEHDREFTIHVATSSFSESHGVADHALQLECNMLDDVRRVGPTLESRDETSALADAATMLFQSWHPRHERFSKTRHICRRNVFIRADSNVHARHRLSRPEICAARRMQRGHP